MDAEVSVLKKNLVAAGAEADEAISRLNDWRLWGIVAKGKMFSMPPSGFPRGHVIVQSERSRSPRRSQVQLGRLEFAPQAARVPEYDG